MMFSGDEEYGDEITSGPIVDEPHASDCATWCDEPCDCLYGKLGDE